MIQTLDLRCLELDQLVFFYLLKLHLVPESIKHFVLGCYLVLDLHKLLLEDLLALFSFGELFPENGIGTELLLQIVNLVIVLLFLNSFFQLLQHS